MSAIKSSSSSATYTKLRNGTWGIRVTGSVRVDDRIDVTLRSGASKTETVARVLWTGDGVSLCAIAPRAPSYSGSGRGRTCPTGGNCSSFGSGRSCGAEECDGY